MATKEWMKGTVAALAVALVGGGCTSEGGPGTTTIEQGPENIPQPVLIGDFQVAPETQRVDITMPTFSNPTEVTNPLFPVSDQRSVLLLGRVDGQPFRTEVTLLPETRIIQWQGQRVEVLVSQYTAYLAGRIHEVAYDFYAQADDGSVWYFGEDVFNFKDGAIADTHGTWLAGKDGPAAMIMPADPQVGDVYRPENIPGFVFEEVTVRSIGQRLDGPLGPIDDGLVIEELHMDGNTEDKSFAPGYGEFYTAGGGDVEALALAVPTDAASSPVPAELVALHEGALNLLQGSKNRSAVAKTVAEMTGAWERYLQDEVPGMIEPRMTRALNSLGAAVRAEDTERAARVAIEVGQWSLDLQLRHVPQPQIDLGRFDLWLAQLQVDAGAGDAAAVNGDSFTLDYIRDRIVHTLDPADMTRLNTQMEELAGAVGDEDLDAAADVAGQLRGTLAQLR